MRSTHAPKGKWQGIMRSTHAPEGKWQDARRSTRAPQGQRAPSPGQVSAANDTLGYANGFPMRPRRGQKQRQKHSCHGFCPLRGRIVCASTKPRVSLAALACPGLGACCPFGALVERSSHAWISFGARVERLSHAWKSFGARVFAYRINRSSRYFGRVHISSSTMSSSLSMW